jgi:endonuclease YncB( thermonuclease family)
MTQQKKRSILLIINILIFFIPVVSLAGQFKVIRVYDGDTLKAKGHGIEFKVRLVGIDAPETNDRYNRILAEVFVYDKNVNLEMVKAGLAEYYRGKKPKRFDRMPYQLAETKAKNEGIGMWSLGDQYISPKDWRRMHRK